MSILGSLFFGCEGSYNVVGTKVAFSKTEDERDVFPSCLGKVVNLFLSNRLFNCLTFGYLHVFFHEMGHATACRLLKDHEPEIHINTGNCTGATDSGISASPLRDMITTLSGPLAGVVFEVAKLVAAVALMVFLPLPIGIPLGIALGFGSVVWIKGETLYALVGGGDWGHIKDRGIVPYIACLLIYLLAIAAGICGAAFLALA